MEWKLGNRDETCRVCREVAYMSRIRNAFREMALTPERAAKNIRENIQAIDKHLPSAKEKVDD